MSAARRRSLRAVLSILLLTAGALVSLSIHDGKRDDSSIDNSLALFAEPQLQLRYGRNRMYLETTTISAEHEAALLELVDDQFNGVDIQTNFRQSLIVGQGWDAVSARLIYLTAATHSAVVSIDENGVVIRGVSSDAGNYQNRLEFLQDALPDGTTVDADVLFIDGGVSFAALCARNFDSFAQQVIQFRQSSSTVRQSSLPLLDRLIEFAYDCRQQKIAIVGHSDATGNEPWNVQISKIRAQTVADHLIAGGVPAERLIVEGIGSRQPLAENDTAQGRERNRRIEFELR